MSGSVNSVTLIGNLGRDPEIKRAQSGDAIAHLSVATSESWKDKATGERKERTEWHRVSVFGGLAEVCARYLTKGALIFAHGQLRTRKWKDLSGQDRYTTEVVLSGPQATLKMLDGARKDNGAESRQSPRSGAAAAGRPTAGGGYAKRRDPPSGGGGESPDGFDDLDDSIPFLRGDLPL